MSGYASTLSWRKDQIPVPMSTSDITIMTKRCCRAKRRSFAIMALLGPEQHDAVDDHAIARPKPGDYGEHVSVPLAQFHFDRPEHAGLALDIRYCLSVSLH